MPKEARRLQIIITVSATILAVAHVAKPDINIDTITTSLLVIAIVPWLYPLFKSVELPGGLKLEFQDFEKVIEEARQVNLVPFVGGGGTPQYLKFAFSFAAHKNEFVSAFSGLRLEIEKSLYELAQDCHIQADPTENIQKTIRVLANNKILTLEESVVIKKMLVVLHAGEQGALDDKRAMEIIQNEGPNIIYAIEIKGARCHNTNL